MTSSLRAAARGMAAFCLTVVRHGETRYNKEKIMQGLHFPGLVLPQSVTEGHLPGEEIVLCVTSKQLLGSLFSRPPCGSKHGHGLADEFTMVKVWTSLSQTLDSNKPMQLECISVISDLLMSSPVICFGQSRHSRLSSVLEYLKSYQLWFHHCGTPPPWRLGHSFYFCTKRTTASILKNSQYCKEIPVKCDARLRERKYGVAEGRPLSNLKIMAKAAGEQYPSFTPPGGETLDEVKARVKDFFEYICSLVAQEACLEKQVFPSSEGNNTEMAKGSSTRLLPNHHGGLECDSNSEGAAGGLAANILVVSHGAYMRNWVGYFIADLQCTLPATLTKAELSSVTPNTGISRFLVKLEMRENVKPKIHCIFLNRSDHLHDINDS